MNGLNSLYYYLGKINKLWRIVGEIVLDLLNKILILEILIYFILLWWLICIIIVLLIVKKNKGEF